MKTSSDEADNTVTYLALFLRLCIAVMIGFIFIKLYLVTKSEPLLQLNKKMYTMHIVTITFYYVFWAAYEVCFNIFEFDNDYVWGENDAKLTLLAVISLLFNTFSVFLGLLLFYMVEKMTHPVIDAYYDPILKRQVPFFVYLANFKLVIDQFEK